MVRPVTVTVTSADARFVTIYTGNAYLVNDQLVMALHDFW